MRKGVKWHDGTPRHARRRDLLVHRRRRATKAPMYKPFVSNIASIEKRRRQRTLRFKLKRRRRRSSSPRSPRSTSFPRRSGKPKVTALEGKPENGRSPYQEDKPHRFGPVQVRALAQERGDRARSEPRAFLGAEGPRWILRIVPNTEAALGMLKSGEINFLSDYAGDPKLLEQLVASTPSLSSGRRPRSSASAMSP